MSDSVLINYLNFLFENTLYNSSHPELIESGGLNHMVILY